jgi:hypothetical protein
MFLFYLVNTALFVYFGLTHWFSYEYIRHTLLLLQGVALWFVSFEADQQLAVELSCYDCVEVIVKSEPVIL